MGKTDGVEKASVGHEPISALSNGASAPHHYQKSLDAETAAVETVLIQMDSQDRQTETDCSFRLKK